MVHGPPARRKSNVQETNTKVEQGMNSAIIAQPISPDGGWGWMVVFGSFMIHIINDGITYSFGLFYNEFLNYFNEGKGYTAWIVSIMVGVTFASGPISSSFVNRYGCRTVTIAGSILAAFCIIISMFAQNVLTLIFTIGLGTGLGFGLIYLPAIVSVSTWFEAKRSLATGIAVCGSGFGTFVFAPLTEYLIGAFGWRGALLITGAIVLNCIIFGAMFRPLDIPKQPKIKRKDIIDNHTTLAELKPLKAHLEVNIEASQGVSVTKLEIKDNATPSRKHSNAKSDYGEQPTINGNGSHTLEAYKSISHHDIRNESLKEVHKEKSVSGTMYRPDILYQGSLHSIPEYSRSRNDLTALNASVNHYGSTKHSNLHLTHKEELQKCCGCFTCSQETRDTFVEMMNFSLLKDYVFIIFALSNFCTSIGFNIPYIYIVAQADALQLSTEQSSYLISVIGVANTVGRIILGYISDKPWVNRMWIYNYSLTICGIATALCPLCSDFYSLAFYCAVFGFTIGAYVGLTSVILVDLLGLDKLTNAFGLLLLFQGVASFIGPPIGGWLYDITFSYGPAFILAGTMIAISGLVMFFIPPLQRYQKSKSTQHNTEAIVLS